MFIEDRLPTPVDVVPIQPPGFTVAVQVEPTWIILWAEIAMRITVKRSQHQVTP